MNPRFTLLFLAIAFALTISEPLPAQPSNHEKKITACDLQSNMHKLWEDHVQWTRFVILNIMDDLPGTSQQVARLLKNQDDIGNAIKPFYGEAAGNHLTELLRQHIIIAADLLTALKNNNTAAFNTANAQWSANADDIAAFLNSLNPKNWPLDEMKTMMHTHLNLTAQEALARKNHDYNADVTAYENVHLEILEMADMLASGIAEQFPNRFSGCSLQEHGQQTKLTACDLASAMDKLWEDHITWTRNVIFNLIDNLPGTTQAVTRLLQNQVDIGNAIKPFYGAAAGNHLTALLHDHITIAATLLTALKNNDASGLTAANTAWYVNADSIAKFLSTLNPLWTYPDMKNMMFMHLDLTKAESVARKTGDYTGDVAAYDHVHNEILEMADMLTQGIVKQFPNQFAGCPLTVAASSVMQGMLHQNYPNPFSGHTTISFFIPQSVGKAQLLIFDNRGNVVKQFNLQQRGEGSVVFTPSNLTTGILTYSLVTDGKTVDTRKMVH